MACRELLLAVCVCMFLSAGSNAYDCKSVSSMSGHMKAANIFKCYEVRVKGAANGTVWGNNYYTPDSDIATAAVHAGLFKVGETGVVRIELRRGRSSYEGVSRNGIRTRRYDGSQSLSYIVLNNLERNYVPCKSVSSISGHLKAANIGKCYYLTSNKVKGVTSGKVWGDGIYTADSNIGKAAVHAGLYKIGEFAYRLGVRVLPGRNSYEGTTHHGIQTLKYGKWPLSFTFT